jgi:hypothetical protein
MVGFLLSLFWLPLQKDSACSCSWTNYSTTNYYKDSQSWKNYGWRGYDTRKEVPILCYHNIKDFADQAGEMTKTYTVKPLSFAAQMKPFTTLVTTVST